MKIGNFRLEKRAGGARATARVEWEESDRKTTDVFYDVATPDDEFVRASPDAFLLACFPFAFHHGEGRLLVEGAICPVLRDGVFTAMRVLRHWYGPSRTLLAIESTGGLRPSAPPSTPRTASLFSGGVDSLFTLRRNVLEVPREHPSAIRDLIVTVGHDDMVPESSASTTGLWQRIQNAQDAIAADSGVGIVRMRFNFRRLDPDLSFYVDEAYAAVLASCAHALSERYSTLLVASTHTADDFEPSGSSFVLDPYYASAGLTVRHEGAAYSRLEKLRQIADWPLAIRSLRVCNGPGIPEGFANCGSCEKCLRTRVALLSIGRLGEAAESPPGPVTPDEIRKMGWVSGFEGFWEELEAGARQIGRLDLAREIARRLADSRRHGRWLSESDWRGALKRLDRRLFGGRIQRAFRQFRRRQSS